MYNFPILKKNRAVLGNKISVSGMTHLLILHFLRALILVLVLVLDKIFLIFHTHTPTQKMLSRQHQHCLQIC